MWSRLGGKPNMSQQVSAPDCQANGVAEEPPRIQRRVRFVIALVLALAGLWTVRHFLPALAWAAILAIATWPLYRRAESRWTPSGHNIVLPALFTLAVALVVLVPLALAGIQLAREAHVIVDFVEEARRTGIAAPPWLANLPLGGPALAAWWGENLAAPGGAGELIGRFGHGAVTGYTRSLGGQLIHRSVIFFFTILTLFFLYRDGRWLTAELVALSHRVVGPPGERIGRQMVASVHGTVDGLVLVGLGEGFLLGVAYWLAGVPHPTLFGAATAIAAMIPFAAPVLFCAAGLLLAAKGAVGAAVAVVVFGAVVVFVADHAVRPALIGGATKLPFVWVLLGILGGVESFGLIGLFLGPAIMAALHLLWRDWTGSSGEAPAA